MTVMGSMWMMETGEEVVNSADRQTRRSGHSVKEVRCQQTEEQMIMTPTNPIRVKKGLPMRTLTQRQETTTKKTLMKINLLP
mmetsp:Transcript_31485/g.70843  ORF Transcript_31485/g.70843 Transcript_31485/m.70843 type:complete len:82 (+) Transcript_31485:166-411(+)